MNDTAVARLDQLTDEAERLATAIFLNWWESRVGTAQERRLFALSHRAERRRDRRIAATLAAAQMMEQPR